MKLANQLKTYVISKGQIKVELLESGDVFKWMHGDHQINLLQGNLLDGMIANLYLREQTSTGFRWQKLMGIHSPSEWQLTSDGALYQGNIWDVHYRIRLSLTSSTWFYQVELSGKNPQARYDLIYGQDIGIAHPFGILSNEAYTSQYIDHQVFAHPKGYTLLSRQNQGLTHYVQLGCDYPTVGYSTDAMQFFGLSYKLDHQPMALMQAQLPNQNYQYEFAYLALQTQLFSLNHQPLKMVFYGHSHQEAHLFLKEPFQLPKFELPPLELQSTIPLRLKGSLINSRPLHGEKLSPNDLKKLYPNMDLIEEENGEILSAFLPDHTHLVTQTKELKVERPHGHILLSGDVLHASEDVFATTAYMSGIFGSHTVYGNTNFHKLTGDLRHPLNAHTIAGTRIYLKHQGRYHLLGLPSLFFMKLDQVVWLYVLPDDVITITLQVDGIKPKSGLSFVSKKHIAYDLLLSQQWLLDSNEYQHPIQYEHHDQTLIIDGRSSGMIAGHYPGLRYRVHANKPFTLTHLQDWVQPSQSDGGMVFLSFTNIHSLEFLTEATLKEEFLHDPTMPKEGHEYRKLVHQLVPLSIEHVDQTPQWKSFQALIPWYVHDALIHYASPHGLEQYNGAAWGTRDVLQGPFELFLTAQRFDLNKEILLKVFARQFSDTKEFPQWFMFDHYRHIQAHESHGDVLVWPLKALASYLQATDDTAILEFPLPYMDKASGQWTATKVPLKDHVWAIILRLKESFIPNTHLPAYGGGDWDDTLQPANAQLTKQMVSGWTVALLYEALKGLTRFPLFQDSRQMEIQQLIEKLLQDYQRYLVVDGVPAGFVVFYDDHREVLLHPRDQTTGLKYRLLPFNRGIISELFPADVIPQYQQLIHRHLRHPDGVRLMDTAVRYQGGKKTYFQRAETAANFGREIGIQYVHAHIRYIEAMCTIGDAKEAWWGLNVINPIGMKPFVNQAALRQRNVYFSSSDAAFMDRYQAKKDFEKVRQGTIAVKAGWRLYSSGPGIYLQTLIRHFMGIRVEKNQLVVDPQQAEALKGLTIHYHYLDKPLTIDFAQLEKPLGHSSKYRKHFRFELVEKNGHLYATIK